ncbi:hypothetical protein V501_02965 [Pseudogymnoascus sp. VKM F-4519 (FW-2642)]|nr:hypothetical protein V501_02965 [Pseudogymnoascus sp. VKM F-4519 (FW-2642)]
MHFSKTLIAVATALGLASAENNPAFLYTEEDCTGFIAEVARLGSCITIDGAKSISLDGDALTCLAYPGNECSFSHISFTVAEGCTSLTTDDWQTVGSILCS